MERHADFVRRPLGFWSSAVHGLLGHLEAVGFPAPRLVNVTDDYEELTWVEGESGAATWAKVVDEEGLGQWARLLRRYHDAVRDYRAEPDAVWSRGRGTGFICHGDPGPWNTVWKGGTIVAFIDFDHAHPGSPQDDIVYALEFGAPFRDDDTCVKHMAYPSTPDRRRRIQVLCDAYGVAVPANLATLVADRQLRDGALVADLARRGLEPQATWVREGYLETIRRRAEWSASAKL
ncbi:MAG: phosphotransferase [Actinomycetota bacterium]